MKPLEDIYKAAFFSKRHKLLWRAPIVCGGIMRVLEPKSVIDVGCAIGDYVAHFKYMGADAKGLEGSIRCLPFLKVPEDWVFIRDLRLPVRVGHYELAVCFEVLEHVEPEYADQLVENLIRMSDQILTSAAPPGAGGHYHLNCQPREYWVQKFWNLGYVADSSVVEAVRKEWEAWRGKKEMSSYYNNLMFFKRDKEC